MCRAFSWRMLAVALLAIAISGSMSVAARQTAPAEPVVNVSNPSVRETVSFVSESGNEVARLRVTDVILLWNEFGEFYAPQPGSLYVAIIVEVTSFGSRGSLILRADDFRLQDIDGFLYGRSWADADDEAELVPSEGEVGVSPGETEELVLVYEVLIGVELSKLFWQPDYERLLTIADLNNYIPDEE